MGETSQQVELHATANEEHDAQHNPDSPTSHYQDLELKEYGITRREWQQLLRSFLPGLENATQNQKAATVLDKPIDEPTRLIIAGRVEELVRAVAAASRGERPKSSPAATSTPSGALVELYGALATFGVGPTGIEQFVSKMTDPPGELYRVMGTTHDTVFRDLMSAVPKAVTPDPRTGNTTGNLFIDSEVNYHGPNGPIRE